MILQKTMKQSVKLSVSYSQKDGKEHINIGLPYMGRFFEKENPNKVSKCKLKKYLFGEKNERKTGEFRYSMTITIRPLVA